MDLREYFENTEGFGVLSTADDAGRVNAAVFARPHCFEDKTVGFIMPNRLTYQNLQVNGRASYLFREEPGNGERKYQGVRLHLTKVREDDEQDRIAKLRRRVYGDDRDGRFLVIFAVDQQLPLIGPGKSD